MSKQDEIRDALIASALVAKSSHWETDRHSREYLTMRSHSQRYRGCATAKIYWDNHSGELVVQQGKGTYPTDWYLDVEELKDLYVQLSK